MGQENKRRPEENMPLDRDPPHGRAQWRLRVTASDGELEAHTNVRVNLKDVNDNAPYFPSHTTTTTVSEDTPKGTVVAQMLATDHDDPDEGHNARLVYSLEKNVIDESSGSAIFSIDSQLGLITTALCCLDREKTQRYTIQVVATDGGGLKGTGTVVVEVGDVNDVPPRFSRPEWTLDVCESLTPDHVLATLTVVDNDVSNNFSFRVVPGSGRGWQLFRVEGRRRGSPGGDLRSVTPLDYENPSHRRGFRFRVQVTDMGGHGRVRYKIAEDSDPRRQFGVDGSGAVWVVGNLDRETAAAHTVLVWAVDDGNPPRTATATLTVNVTDVNDNPPFLAEPRQVQVVENGGAQVVARVRLGDPDDWRQGHGPPFTVALDPRAPQHVADTFRVTHDKRGDEGRGVGVVWARAGLDREERRSLLVPLLVADAGWPPLTTTATLTVHVADLNDNPMTPASKTVIVHTLQPQGKPVPLGRVYVKDPDDWDSASKTYSWRQYVEGFFLNSSNGDLTMAPDTPEGRYELSFKVNDASQGQFGVRANVTVEVKTLNAHDVTYATPITLAADPYQLVVEREGGDSSTLSLLESTVRAWVGRDEAGVWAVSVEALEEHPTPSTITDACRVWLVSPGMTNLQHLILYRKLELSAILGVSVREVGIGTCQEASPVIDLDDAYEFEGEIDFEEVSNAAQDVDGCMDGCWVRAALGEGFSVVDANTSALVGPRMEVLTTCGCGNTAPDHTTCSPYTCLNGGRCIPTPTGTKCICPHGTWGSRCKVVVRHFEDSGGGRDTGGEVGEDVPVGGWAWVAPIPPCAEVHLSLEVLTRSPAATLLYSGPDHGAATSDTEDDSIRELLLLELRQGRPSLLLDLGGGPVTLTLNASSSLADNTWHRIDLIWKDELVEMIVDLCTGGGLDEPPTFPSSPAHATPTDAHTCRGAARLPRTARVLNASGPLQVGGLAHPLPAHYLNDGTPIFRPPHFQGCLRNLRVNGQVRERERESDHTVLSFKYLVEATVEREATQEEGEKPNFKRRNYTGMRQFLNEVQQERELEWKTSEMMENVTGKCREAEKKFVPRSKGNNENKRLCPWFTQWYTEIKAKFARVRKNMEDKELRTRN
nr:putative neural-cadherin 2 [Cherax quadricarinatus]